MASVLLDRPAERDFFIPLAEMREARLGAMTRLPVLGPKVLGLWAGLVGWLELGDLLAVAAEGKD
jgi:hypothetical protein